MKYHFSFKGHRMFIAFISWGTLIVVGYWLSFLFPLQMNYLGGGTKHYIIKPLFWMWANFDGEHYVSIAREGYKPLQYFFFPVYPLIVRSISQFFNQTVQTYVSVGMAVSIVSLVGAFVGLKKLLLLDYSISFTRSTLLLILLFPTSFYFSAVYTESLFLCLIVWSFYFARKGNWILSALLACIASGTRVIGVILFPVLLIELFTQIRNTHFEGSKLWKVILPTVTLMFIPIGLLLYMNFLNHATGDPLIFKNAVGIFGEQRSETLIALPQVLYRYFFKILPNLNSYLPVVYSTLLEFTVGLSFFLLSIYSFFRLRISYSIFFALGYLIPTLAGSFSSMPRYVLVLFPAFICINLLLNKMSKPMRFLYILASIICLIVSVALFSRGYWIS